MNIKSVAATGLIVLGSLTSHAVMIGFEPNSQTVPAGSNLQIELTISDLGFGGAPSLGTFDLTVTYDPSILSFGGATLGDPALGDQLDLGGLGAITSIDLLAPGVLNLFELSLDTATDLDTLQPDAFTLAVISFSAIAPGSSALSLQILALGDSQGDPLTATVLSGTVTVERASAVPDTGVGACALFLCAFAMMKISGATGNRRSTHLMV